MISSDDVNTRFGRQVVIRPSIKFYDDRYDYLRGSRLVAGDFIFNDNNTEWLSDGALKALLSEQLRIEHAMKVFSLAHGRLGSS